MIRIRRVFNDSLPSSRQAIAQVQEILRRHFPDISAEEVDKLPLMLADPLKYKFKSMLYIVDKGIPQVEAFALLLHAPNLNFCFLDFISAGQTGRGLGSILYETVRQEALFLNACGIFFECLPDDPRLCRDETMRKQNISRLRFYERFGARPVVNTKYETPLAADGDNPPYLVFDDLGRNRIPSLKQSRALVRAILERKYGGVCSPAYIDMVVKSFNDDPLKLRPFRYVNLPKKAALPPTIPQSKKFVLVFNKDHEIHHIRERGYVESPVRINSILKHIIPSGIFNTLKQRKFPQSFIYRVHERSFIDYFKRVCRSIPSGHSLYPYIFPIRNRVKKPRVLSVLAGYYCMDTFTPLTKNAYLAARSGVDCVLTGADAVLEGMPAAYALVRPPGHHAERSYFGGFCYFNNAAIAADYLARYGKVAILDVDYHHGNGQQEIFYERDDVLTVSLHGHPNFAYPYFSGFADEVGRGKGFKFNLNIPLAEQLDGPLYRQALNKALFAIKRFGPDFLIIAFGLDTAKNDPTGTWSLLPSDFNENGKMIGSLKIRTLFVQEGGYDNRSIGKNAAQFFKGFWAGYFSSANRFGTEQR